ncbi:cysteine--tRNA ligase [Microbacterium sp. GXF7504]
MTVRLFDTQTQTLRDFTPLDPENVTMYVCGPTVQSGPHVGHLRGGLAFDVLRRWLEYRFGRVTYVRNVTDIDDKVLQNATNGEPWWALAYRTEQEFDSEYAAIGIRPPTYEPRATGAIPEMIGFIERLIEAGHAYPALDGSGDVYFDVRSWPSYGSLTHQELDAMEPAADADSRGKRDPRDFALWKSAKPWEPADATWQTPWGSGRPGWHIECSAMSRRYLGPAFDIHGGGLDLRFPHHENELAQSRAAGDPFARYWIHNGLVNVSGQKMSKSLGNFLLARDLRRAWSRNTIRYGLLAAHYRSSLDVSNDTFLEARRSVERIERFLGRAREFGGNIPTSTVIADDLAEAMDDDLNVPAAFAAIHTRISYANRLMDTGQSTSMFGREHEVEHIAADIRAFMKRLGFTLRPKTAGRRPSGFADRVEQLIADRESARNERNWERADKVRAELDELGVFVTDTPDGPVWRRK